MSSILNRIRASTLQRSVVVVLVAVFVCTAFVPVSFAKAPRFEETRHDGDADGVGGFPSVVIVKSSGDSPDKQIKGAGIQLSLVRFVVWMAKLETVLFIRVR